ncbi:MAG: MerR family transcriptional regulator [Firmicutes bacterium]|nr:MerR family transcriptional regulator [Bacillota bacterium]
MKIHEVESRTGITKKNIRFYEEQRLLNPKRNTENGYREYSEEDVMILQRIKFMRKLGVSIEEIRQMLSGHHTVGDGMGRHLITLEREKENLNHSIAICKELVEIQRPLGEFDVTEILYQMEEIEAAGATFKDKQKEDIRVQYVVPVVIAALAIAFIAGGIALIIWSYGAYPEDAPPMAFVVFCVLLLLGVAGGIVLALIQRIREIGKGEVHDARRY